MSDRQAASERTCVPASPCVMVIFGASGDLTARKLIPALYGLEEDGLLDDGFAVVGFARTPMGEDVFRKTMRAAVLESRAADDIDASALDRLTGRLHYVTGRYYEPQSYNVLGDKVSRLARSCGARGVLYYAALPPSTAEVVLASLKRSSLVLNAATGSQRRIMVEKPFGLDLAGAHRLNSLLSEIFDEREVYRVDHYLGKDTIRNLMFLRFANSIFEPLWNARHVDNIQITASEAIGVEGRGGYYDQAGVVRDMVQNHVLHVLSLIAMDPPVAGDAESLRDRKAEVLKSLSPIPPDNCVFGQYDGYRGEANVAPDSTTPTYVALRAMVNNRRWHGVPFYIRAGKAMKRRFTEVTVVFKNIPLCAFDSEELCRGIEPNVMFVRIQPDEGVKLAFSVKVPGREDAVRTATMDFAYSQLGRKIPDAYERVLLDGLRGVPTLFWRCDAIEEAWKAVEPLLSVSEDAPEIYQRGSWGPEAAGNLPARDGRQWVSSY